jgi:hypothetical protein
MICGFSSSLLQPLTKILRPNFQVIASHFSPTRNLSNQQEIFLADCFCIFMDCPAEVSGHLPGHMLNSIDPEPIAIAEGNPVLIDPNGG